MDHQDDRSGVTPRVCDGYDGVLHIQSGDAGAAAGTVFFQYVINQLIYAEMYGLLPWVHLNSVSEPCYDQDVHGIGPVREFRMLGGPKRVETYPPNGSEIPDLMHYASVEGMDGGQYPGAPNFDELSDAAFKVSGNGVWNSYFQPVSTFRPGRVDDSCRSKPLVALSYRQLSEGIHWRAPWAVRCWPYIYIPEDLRPPRSHATLHEWYGPMRKRASEIVEKYYRPQPWLAQEVDRINPASASTRPCLAIHVRHSDKGGVARRIIRLDEYLPYAVAFVEAGGDSIYLETDSSIVLDEVRRTWPKRVTSLIQTQTSSFRSDSRDAVFDLVSHHRSNTEALVAMYALSKCGFLLHGFSAMSESAIYLNVDLHDRSVDLEDPDHMTATEFGELVRLELVSA